jgi:hypothetical protein
MAINFGFLDQNMVVHSIFKHEFGSLEEKTVHIEVNWFENIHQMQDFSFPKYILKYHKK